ncbi:UvrB/UvrC motif-containing protein [Alkalibacter rhizosphaerae]|uniref:UvrB/UvrC motif-containing protein n=1 Tax=Alkalibacter rhizosphaerae TaxID=2815577 RepID=A0A975AHW6_9FIRM|nr:UvrB/UvrC motif-containing protein [Alkalibacter rhizosphaerae]QSX07915.1 UvrB/UvrC motif-containing protein [Alkalibacter rhizosphaerae]
MIEVLCDNCKERQATIHITKIINGQKKEHHLCDQCTSLDKLGKEAFDYTGFISDVANDGKRNPSKEQPGERTCSRCGMTYEFFRKHGKFGCGECYDAFEPMIVPMIRRMHGKDRHIGKVIKNGDRMFQRKRELEVLQAKLDEAVEKEEYEMAAQYRDQIKALVSQTEEVED